MVEGHDLDGAEERDPHTAALAIEGEKLDAQPIASERDSN
jgi:hypothetical protein